MDQTTRGLSMQAARNKWIVGAIGGLVGGMVFAMWEMVVEGIRSATGGGSFWGSLSPHSGFWAAPQWIGATLIRSLQTSRDPSFDLGPLILGIMGHPQRVPGTAVPPAEDELDHLRPDLRSLCVLSDPIPGRLTRSRHDVRSRRVRRHVVAGRAGRRSCHARGQWGVVLHRPPHVRWRPRLGGRRPSRACRCDQAAVRPSLTPSFPALCLCRDGWSVPAIPAEARLAT
jgi:hypothetical protein